MKQKVKYAQLGILLLIGSFVGSLLFQLPNSESRIQPFIPQSNQNTAIIADHTVIDQVRLDLIAEADIINAKDTLHVAYGHTSHGSQIITGMTPLAAFKEANGGTEGLYDWSDGPENGSLDLDDDFIVWDDLGHNGDVSWATSTRTYLDDRDNEDVNVVMWSWCGGVTDNNEEGINIYLNEMNALESEYLAVKFVYMTGHADGTGEDGNLHIRNQQIRDYCVVNNKILFDFYDIECYNPSGNYYGDKAVNDNCDYDSNDDGTRDSNWAVEWQESHTEDEDWYACSAAHSKPLNGNSKAYAAWWLFATIAGADTNNDTNTGTTTSTETESNSSTTTEFLGISYNTLIGAGFGLGFLAMVVTVGIIIKKQR